MSTYAFTGLNELGDELNQISLNNMYKENLIDWEKAINYFLETGKKIE